VFDSFPIIGFMGFESMGVGLSARLKIIIPMNFCPKFL
jgi:hypothetical protein